MKYILDIQKFGEKQIIYGTKNISTTTKYSPTEWVDSTGTVLGSAAKQLTVTPTENIVSNGIKLKEWDQSSVSTSFFDPIVLPTEVPVNNTDKVETLSYSTTLVFHYNGGTESDNGAVAAINKKVTYYTPFIGYATSKSSISAMYLPGDNYTPNSTLEILYGFWGNRSITEDILSETKIVLPNTTKDNFKFGGWYTGENGTGTCIGYGDQLFSAIMDIPSLDVYAYWQTLEPMVIDYDGKVKDIRECYTQIQNMWISLDTEYMQNNANEWFLRR